MNIEINENTVKIDGRTYQLISSDYDMCGRKEIAEMCGFRHSTGEVNTSNLYANNKNAPLFFPNFEIEKAKGKEKPWRRKEVEAWLSIPLWKRKKMWEESHDTY